MKILQIINSLHFGGAEKLLVESIPLYKEKGLIMDILLLNGERTPFYDELKNKNVNIIHLNSNRSLYSPLHINALRKYLKRYDIVHVHLFPALYWVALANIFKTKKPKLVLTEHNTENRRRKITIFKYLDKFIYSKFSRIIAISDGVASNLKTHLSNSKTSISVINNGINLEAIKKATPYKNSDLGIPEESKVVIQVSSFTSQKDQKTLIKAMSSISKNVHLLLIGDGPLKNENEALVKKLQLEQRVHFLGHRSDVPKLVNTADISVLSSHYEGFGLAIVEGMAAGNASIGSNVPGLSEIIGQDGVLFEPGHDRELQDIIEKLISDKDYYKQISEKCLKKSNQYDINQMVEKYINVYNEIT
ncbi:glycosyltransferase family 1 protein [Aquimarina addita]|uniref:Glycosyltransferase family 1 protein n=1 Tax=Aquimarina addita TaxID=870485 RepID=A0ABP7XFD3_9FLAO